MTDWLDHYRRWNIEVTEETFHNQFKYRLSNRLKEAEFKFTKDEISRFNFFLGRHTTSASAVRMHSVFDTATNSLDHLTMIQAVFQVLQENKDSGKTVDFYGFVSEALRNSSGVKFRLGKTKDSAIVYPIGADFLDKEIINRDLLWLMAYPQVLAPFENALKSYTKADKDSRRNIQDDLRLALEELLKAVLNNEKGLENQKDYLLPWLKKKGVDTYIINLYQHLLFVHFKDYQNRSVKHKSKDDYSEEEVEFMIYLTGTFMRLLLQLEKSA